MVWDIDDIKESFVQNRRTAVLAMYRRKVKGTILGSSKQEASLMSNPK
jgi:DNA mismatch repair protein MutS2